MKSQMRAAAVVLFLAVAVPTLGGCSSLAPVQSPRTELFAPYPIEQVEQSILLALTRKGWTVLERAPGAITAQITRSGLLARVSIRYNTAGWVIDRLDTSPQFKYRPQEGTAGYIHGRYNQWVVTLDREINSTLTTTYGFPTVQRVPAQPGTPATATPPAATGTVPAQPAPAGTGPAPAAGGAPAQPVPGAQPAPAATAPAQPAAPATAPAQPAPVPHAPGTQ